jgi:hypothetical protein
MASARPDSRKNDEDPPLRRETSVGYRFGDHPLDVERRKLHRRDELIVLEPQVFDYCCFIS